MHGNKIKFYFTSMINVIDISCKKTALVDLSFVTLAFDYVTQTMSHDLKKVSSCHNHSVNFWAVPTAGPYNRCCHMAR